MLPNDSFNYIYRLEIFFQIHNFILKSLSPLEMKFVLIKPQKSFLFYYRNILLGEYTTEQKLEFHQQNKASRSLEKKITQCYVDNLVEIVFLQQN